MNDLRHPCEHWAERISLAAAGCLSPDEEREVHRHIETCSDCRERFRQLTEMCGVLAELRLPAVGTEAAILERVMSVVASGDSERPVVRTRVEMIRPTFFTRSLTKWRWIMRHPVSLATAAAIFVLAVTGVALWFHGGGTTPAFADFLQPLLDAKTVKYKTTVDITSPSAAGMLTMVGLSAEMQKDLMKATTAEVMMLDANRMRTEWEMGDKSKKVDIWDGGQGKQLMLEPAEKRATVWNYANVPKDKTLNGNDRGSASPRRRPEEPWPVACFRSALLDARDKPDVKHESLGEKEIDGRQVVGFRISRPGMVMSVWGDPKTGLPVRIESTQAIMSNYKVTMSDFAFNVDMDESLFSVEPPAGYEVIVKQGHTSDDSPTGEKDLIEVFRYYSEWNGGRFPDLLDMGWLSQVHRMEEWLARNLAQQNKPMAKVDQELAEADAKLQRGMTFVVSLPKEADSHYAGKGVSLGAPDTPIFWYRPKDAKTYRVIYADLSVHQSDTPPSVPVVPVAQLEKDLIEMFRQYSELSGGPFPDSLDMGSVSQIVWEEVQIQRQSFNSLNPPQKPGAKEEQEIAEAQTKLLRGSMFAGLLPKEADSHYAGKGVSIGAADRPIFWYRPKDAKKYRVVYADLSVRDADTPPSVPVAQPESDLINTFRHYSELSGGPFPAKLDMVSLSQIITMKIFIKFPPEDVQKPGAKQLREVTKAQMRLQPGLTFVASLPPKADAHYAGKGVSLGAADTPIFWYRPKDSKTYRVIYADLSVRDADTPPNVPDAQPEEDLIDALRYYSKLSGGPFPDSLDTEALSPVMEKKFGLEKGQEPSAKQMQEMMPEILEITLKFQPGSTFIVSLPPEADAHYAGKGVSLGAADTPIFWYRPKDAKKYRVIYADLSVRDADTPPNVPNAQPVPAPSSPKK